MFRLSIAAAVALISLVWTTASFAQNYLIQPGDQLSIEVLEDPELNRAVLVTPDGRISFPLAGTVQAGGRTTAQVERALRSALANSFANPPTVFVAVGALAPVNPGSLTEQTEAILVYLVGEVQAPGPKSVLPGTTVLQLLSQSGGFTRFAATKRLQLRRTNPQTGQQQLTLIDYRAISRGAVISNEPILQEGDVLVVPERRLFE
ncbi:MAG: polysaccharide biosynthesis/export family protein [Pseudomonadota bacterium]